MNKYVRVMNSVEAKELYEEFFSRNWNKITVDQTILAWCEITFQDLGEDQYRATVWLASERVYAGVILRRLGFEVAETH